MLEDTTKQRFYRKIIRIKAQDSPNVRYAEAQIAAGQQPTGEMIVPGVLSWHDYCKRRLTWDAVRQCIGLDAEFWDGSEVFLFPTDWLSRAEQYANYLNIMKVPRIAKAIGVDPAEGGDKTTMAVGDEYGVMDLISSKTPDTSVIGSRVIELGRKYRVPPDKWFFDRGGGGKQIVDSLRARGYPASTVAFGETVTPQLKRGTRREKFEKKVDQVETRYAYFNRRSEMYGILSIMLDPGSVIGNGAGLPAILSNKGYSGYGIPAELGELRRQLSLIPKRLDGEGRLKMLPKNKRTAKSNEECLSDIIGHSPDEADAVVLMVYGLTHEIKRLVVGGFMPGRH